MAYEITFRSTPSAPGASKLAQLAGCPLEVKAIQIAHDAEAGRTFLQSKIRNSGVVAVTSFRASFVINPADGSPSRVEALAMDDASLAAGENRSFAVETTVHEVADVTVTVDQVTFDGGATWPGDAVSPAEAASPFGAPTTPMAPGAPAATADATQVMPTTAAPIAPGHDGGAPLAGAPTPAPKKGKLPVIIAIAVVALLAAGGVGFAMANMGNPGNGPATLTVTKPKATKPKTTEPQTTEPQTTAPETNSGNDAEKILVGHWAGTALMGDGDAENLSYYSDDDFYADFYEDGTVFWSLDDEDDGSWWGTWEVDPDQDVKGRTYFLVDFDDAHWLAATQDSDDNDVLYMTSIKDSDYGVVFERD